MNCFKINFGLKIFQQNDGLLNFFEAGKKKIDAKIEQQVILNFTQKLYSIFLASIYSFLLNLE